MWAKIKQYLRGRKYQVPTQMFFICKLLDNRGELQDLGMGYFRRVRDVQGNWDGKWWNLRTTDSSYVVPRVHTRDLPRIRRNEVIAPAVIHKLDDGNHEIFCCIRRSRYANR